MEGGRGQPSTLVGRARPQVCGRGPREAAQDRRQFREGPRGAGGARSLSTDSSDDMREAGEGRPRL
eukprot:15275454-Alexandrium_andersonii.AAC.1